MFEASRRNGGDAIDIDPADGPIMSMLVSCQWNNAADDDYVNAWVANFDKVAKEKSKAAGLFYPFNFLNDAQTGQTVFPYYGKGKSLPKLKTIAKRFDPNGVFQTLNTGVFKVSQA